MVTCPDRGTGPCSGRQRAPPIVRGLRALRAELWLLNRLPACGRDRAALAWPCRGRQRVKASGDDLISGGRPPGRPQLLESGDVNQGREMQVLPRELDALDLPVLAVDGVGDEA